MDASKVPAGERKPKRLSLKFKLFCYLGYDLGTLILAVASLLQGAPPERILFIYLENVVVMNFVFWYLFQTRDRSAGCS
jgi:hypothetical protein